jgi:endonuclease/exonuclease/phosphatase family metal-dependent hydrolase
MVQYSGIKYWTDGAARDRTVDRLLKLRAGLKKEVTPNNKQDSFHLATWNIRDLGSTKLNPQDRFDESFMYLAEIIASFDLVAIQEVNENIGDFLRLMRLLGPNWDYIVTDASGNSERLAFAFDTRKIRFRHVAGEVVLPPAKGGAPVAQFNRTPFLLAFQAGWFKFNICTVHLLYGDAADTTEREREISDIAKFFAKRQKKDGETYILLGDFNILNPTDATMKALLDGGFQVPEKLMLPTAVQSANYYDQIAVRTEQKLAEIASAGTFKWQDYVFADEDHPVYEPLMRKTTKTGKPALTDLSSYKKWRTWQMSDHQPLWAEIKMDFTEDYLKSLKTPTPKANFTPASGPSPDANKVL